MIIRDRLFGACALLLVLPVLPTSAEDCPPSVPQGSSRFSWGDYDGDGLEDAFVILPSGQSGLLHNEGDGTLRDVTESVGLDDVRFARFAAWHDVTENGRLDLLVCTRDTVHLFENRERGFLDLGGELGLGGYSGMTAAHWVDFDADGRMDLHLSARGGDVLLRRGGRVFHETTRTLADEPGSSGGSGGNDPQGGASCANAIVDQADGECVGVSSTPTLGMLCPISPDLFVAPTGEVGVGTTFPSARLHTVASASSSFDPGTDALHASGGFGRDGGRGAQILGGHGAVDGGIGMVVTGGIAYGCDYNDGGAGAVLTGGAAVGGYSTGGVGARMTGGTGHEYYSSGGVGAIITGGAGEQAGVGAIVRPGSAGSPSIALIADALQPGGIALDARGFVRCSDSMRVANNLHVGNDAFVVLKQTNRVGIGTAAPTERLFVNGNICATGTVGACSDERFKTEIEPLQGALETVLALRGVSFQWRTSEFPEREFSDDRQLGFVAQEVEALLPEVVSRGSDGSLSVDYGRLTPLLVEAVQVQQDQMQELEGKLANLTQLVERLQAEPVSAAEPE